MKRKLCLGLFVSQSEKLKALSTKFKVFPIRDFQNQETKVSQVAYDSFLFKVSWLLYKIWKLNKLVEFCSRTFCLKVKMIRHHPNMRILL